MIEKWRRGSTVANLSDFSPVAIVTDVHYRMSLALIRDLGEAGVTVVTCEKEIHRKNPGSPALGSVSRYTSRHVWLSGEDIVSALLDLCRQVGEEYGCKPALLPVGAETLGLISVHQQQFSSVAGLLIPDPEQLALMNDKERVAQLAERLEIPTPGSLRITSGGDYSGLPFPCVIKPRCGEKLGLSAAQRYVIVRTAGEAEKHYNRFAALAGEQPLIQRYLAGGGLGCSVLALEGRILAAVAHRRIREYPISGGPSSCCVCVDPAPYLPWVEKMTEQTGYSGLAMFEFKEDDQGKAHLLEVNPRIWGTFPLTRVSGSGMPMLWFVFAWNRGNPDRLLPIPAAAPRFGQKMIFCASDVMAAVGYAKHGKASRALAALGDLLNPTVRDGLLEWKDLRPAVAYFGSLLHKEKHP